ncbi:ABC transporter ATP-binding protein [Prochlorococcus marinus]|uniref:ABC transporter ATP-binding protein n=1 Tax=Prochlorococcus marinus TaxID=1219 RepID=UPI0022B450AC|nr:ABC transporter ATP-binding protein [Prochlorococcus marinus]
MNDNQLEISNLSHHYGDFPNSGLTINSVNLTLKHGELLGLLGPSGCGKTTLLRLIAGFERPYKGIISLEDNIISSPSYILPPERRGIGMVFQDYALFPHLNAWENIIFGLKPSDNKSRAHWLVDLLDLKSFVNRFPHELSGGQRQRLGLARALAPGNSIVVLDEPFSSLDVEVRYRLRNELSRVLSSCSASAILVTHDPQEALGICDRVAVMRNGIIHQCASPIEILTKPETPFIGKFVSQNNLINIQFKSGLIQTSFGKVLVQNHLIKETPELLMLDDNSLEIIPSLHGKCVIKGKEFSNSYWIMRVDYEGSILRISAPLDSTIDIGDNCDVKFISGKYGYLFPGCISCILK